VESQADNSETQVGMPSLLQPNPLVDGAAVTALAPSAYTTSGSGAALQAIPKRTQRTVRVEVNSADRDFSQNPLSSEFRWTFPFPVKEVREVRVAGGTLPVPFLNIDDRWNKFTLMDNYDNYLITIPPGFYTIGTLLTQLQTLLNSIGSLNTYTVSQNSANGVVTISGVGVSDWALLFATGQYRDEIDARTKAVLAIHTPARILGFGTADYFPVGGSVVAPRLPNLWYPLERTYLFMSFDSTQDLRSVFRGAGRYEPSAIFYNDELNIYNQPDRDYTTTPMPLTKYLNKETYDTVISPSPAPLSRISYIEISLRDMFYNPMNTQGREMTLLLDLVIVD
jgi:hypothetical protein